jgi:hypothetical protein
VDTNLPLIEKDGGPAGFVKKQWPALVRTLKQFPIFMVSAVQTTDGLDGKPVPKADSKPANLEKPMEFLLQEMEKTDCVLQKRRGILAAEDAQRRQNEEFVRQERSRYVRKCWIAGTVAFALLVVLVVVRPWAAAVFVAAIAVFLWWAKARLKKDLL